MQDEGREIDRYGEITHEEASEIALWFINANFNNPGKERPRASIPADTRRDDDLRLMEYIRRNKALAAVGKEGKT